MHQVAWVSGGPNACLSVPYTRSPQRVQRAAEPVVETRYGLPWNVCSEALHRGQDKGGLGNARMKTGVAVTSQPADVEGGVRAIGRRTSAGKQGGLLDFPGCGGAVACDGAGKVSRDILPGEKKYLF